MGTASSQEGEHFSQIINPSRPKTPLDGVKKTKVILPGIKLNPAAQILKKIGHDILWECFLSSTAASFALTQSEAIAILNEAALATAMKDGVKKDCTKVESEVKLFIEHVVNLSQKTTSKSVDFMAVCSSILLLSELTIEAKVDQLYEWIVLKENPTYCDATFDEFLVAMSSFERGISHVMGYPSCSDTYIRTVATQWIALADPTQKGSADLNTKISNKNFFEFCTNRQHVVRKLLETFAVTIVTDTSRSELNEVVDTVNAIKPPAGGGDEWMANPAWKKTAERMIPAAVKAANLNIKPTSTLTLEWVHGYRGFDCRNNVYYVDNKSGAQSILYSAAGVGIVLDASSMNPSQRSQCHFSEHGDDIVSMTMITLSTGENLIASGEIGKSPAIYLYSYKKDTSGRGRNAFQSLTCMKGYHTKGVAQLAFNETGTTLFSIGVDYTVAIYDTCATSKTFGRMVVSAQGPKDRIMHCCFSGTANNETFLSCGEKHVILWKIDKGTLKQEAGKVASYKNKFFLCSVQVPSRPDMVLMSTNEGDLLCIQNLTVTPVIFSPALQANQVHGKNAINSLYCISDVGGGGDILVSGGKEGKVIVWRVLCGANTVTLKLIMQFSIYGHGSSLLSAETDAQGNKVTVPSIIVHGVENAGPNLTSTKTAVSKKGANTSGKTAVKGGNNGNATSTTASAAPNSGNAVSSGLPAIRSVCLSDDKQKLLIGTSTCEILEFFLPTILSDASSSAQQQQLQSMRTLVSGHFKDEVWGLAVRPNVVREGETRSEDVEYCTTGDDGYLRFWSLRTHTQLRCLNLKGMSRAVAYSPDGTYLAVGFGGRTGSKNSKNAEDGNVKVFRFDHTSTDPSVQSVMTQVADIKDAKAWISVVRFSPDSSTLAVGARDNSIYLYQVNQQFRKRAKFAKHNAGITQLDFTSDSKYIQSCCSGYEILFSDAMTGTQVTDGATKLMESAMDTWTCTLGWAVIGIWSGAMDGSDVNAVDRSPTGTLIATADDFGMVNVLRYPAIKDGGSNKSPYHGHSSHVTGVKWISLPSTDGKVTDDYLISIGGEDKCVFQWRNSGPEDKVAIRKGEDAAVSLDDIGVDIEDEKENAFDLPSGGDEFTAIKPWLGAIVAPTAWKERDVNKINSFYAELGAFSTQHRRITEEVVDTLKSSVKKGACITSQDGLASEYSQVYSDVSRAADKVLQSLYESGVVNDTAAPDLDELELEWVHGYRGFDCRNNVFLIESSQNAKKSSGSSTDEQTMPRQVVYYAAALGIVLDPITRTQRYFKGHTDDILSMALYKVAASGTTSGDAMVATGQQGMGAILVWEVSSLRTLASVNTKQKCVNMLSFSVDGRLVVSIAEDKTVAVSDWRSATVLCNTKGEAAVTHHLTVSTTASTQLNFLSCGDKYIRLWTLNGRNLVANKVATTGKGKIQQYLCVTEIAGNYYIGCEDGAIYIVKDGEKTVSASFDHHNVEKKAALAKVKNGASVTAIYSCVERGLNLLITGAKDGTIVVWNTALLSPLVTPSARKCEFCVDQLGVSIMAKQIQAISVLSSSSGNDNYLVLAVGTRGCDILEVKIDMNTWSASRYGTSSADGALIRAHCNDELWGVATHPTRPEYCSVGDDKTLRFFNVHTRCMIHSVPLGNIARTICYNTDGSLLAVGFGGRVGKGKESGGGVVRLYSVEYGATGMVVTKMAERQDAKQWISDVKFSPDGNTLAVSAHDCKIYLYEVSKRQGGAAKANAADPDNSPYILKLKSTFAKHNSVLNHIDLSSDGRYMQSNCSAYELLFCDTSTGKQITSATELRDVKWHTWTCTLGWPVQGIWSSGMDGSDINAVARSHSGHLLATSDDFGKVNLFRYPCLATGAQPLKYSGHSSHVMNVRWTVGDECLISCGGNDKCLMQWRHSIADVNSSAGNAAEKISASGRHSRVNSIDSPLSPSEDSPSVDLFGEGPAGGDECGAVKPWLGAIRPPKNPAPISALAPAAELTLSWVHGYTSGTAGANNSRISNNLFYNLELNPVYPAAALGIELNKNGSSGTMLNTANNAKNGAAVAMTQSYFKGHDDDILCLAISKDRRYVATGQTASKTSKGKGGIIVWDANQNRILTRMDGCHNRGVVSLSFNPEGNMLLSVGLDDNNTHNLWSDVGGSWSRVQQVSCEKSDKNPVLFSRWVHPLNPMAQTGEYHFLSGGGGGVNFWKLSGATLSKKQGRFGRKYKQCPLLCAANLQGKESWQMIVGTATGDLYSYAEREVTNSVEKAHQGPVLCLAEGGPDCAFLISGGRDQCVKVWNIQLQPISSFDCSTFSCCNGSIASIDLQPSSGDSQQDRSLVLLVGTYGGEIMELTAKGSGDKKNSSSNTSSGSSSGDDSRNLDISHAHVDVLVHSHFSGELWGVATHPLHSDIVATVGDDSTLRIWSLKLNKMIKCVKLGWPARCVAWHPQGTMLAVGFHESVKGGYKSGGGGGGAKKGSKGKKSASVAPAPNPSGPTISGSAKRGAASSEGDSNNTGTEADDQNGDDSHSGCVHIYSFSKYSALHNTVEIVKRADGCESIAWIADIKFSPDEKVLCVSSHDKKMYAYAVPSIVTGDGSDSFQWDAWSDCLKRPKYVFDKHSSAILHFDFTLDSKYFQTNCQAGELLFGLVESGIHEKSASKVADYNGTLDDNPENVGKMWASQTCILGWSVQGIWPNANNIQLSDINSTDRHVGGKLLATADDGGLVKLFRAPCVTDGSKYNAYSGHSSHVTNVRWNIENHLISTGGNDKCVFVWHLSEK